MGRGGGRGKDRCIQWSPVPQSLGMSATNRSCWACMQVLPLFVSGADCASAWTWGLLPIFRAFPAGERFAA